MKQTLSRKYPVEIAGMPAAVLTISVAVDDKYLSLLDAHGFGAQELYNYQIKILENARDAMDGSVPGLIIENGELER